jgi:hypothetical protein
MNKIYELTEKLNLAFLELQAYKREHPELRLGYNTSFGSLLNAYREGDIEFEECIKILESKVQKGDDSRGQRMKAQFQTEWLVCECGDDLRSVLIGHLKTAFMCANADCQHFKKLFAPPCIELEEVKP